MACDGQVYDPALLGILNQEVNIANFFDVIHDFLLRKTDFYIVKKNKDDRKGFLPGEAFSILQRSFGKFQALAERKTKKEVEAAASRMRAVEKEKKKNQNMPASKVDAPTDAKVCSNSTQFAYFNVFSFYSFTCLLLFR